MAEKENFKKNLDGSYLIYNEKEGKGISKTSSGIHYCRFEFEGKFNPLALESLRKQGYTRSFPSSENHRKEGSSRDIFSYTKENTTISLSTNYETHLHEVGFNFGEPVKDIKIINDLKSNVENLLKKILTNISHPEIESLNDIKKN